MKKMYLLSCLVITLLFCSCDVEHLIEFNTDFSGKVSFSITEDKNLEVIKEEIEQIKLKLEELDGVSAVDFTQEGENKIKFSFDFDSEKTLNKAFATSHYFTLMNKRVVKINKRKQTLVYTPPVSLMEPETYKAVEQAFNNYQLRLAFDKKIYSIENQAHFMYNDNKDAFKMAGSVKKVLSNDYSPKITVKLEN